MWFFEMFLGLLGGLFSSGESDGHTCGCGCGRWIPAEKPSDKWTDENGNYQGPH